MRRPDFARLKTLKKRGAQFRREGRCPACGAPAEFGRVACADHLAYHRDLKTGIRAARRAAEVCLGCGGQRDREGRTLCTACSAATSKRVRTWRAAKMQMLEAERHRKRTEMAAHAAKCRAEGKCTRCLQPAGRDRALCRACTEDAVRSQNVKRAERRASGLCGCGRKPRPGMGSCQRCAARSRKRSEKLRRDRGEQGQCLACKCTRKGGAARCAKHLLQQKASRRRISRRTKKLKEMNRAAA